MRRALGEAVASDLAGSPNLYAQNVDSFDAAYTMNASRVVEGYFVQHNGRLEIHATVSDLAGRKTVDAIALQGPSDEPIRLANQLAKKLSPAARPFSTADENAFRSYGEALSATDRSVAVQDLEEAAKADPRFSLALLDLAQLELGAGDRPGALQAVEAAKRNQPDAINSAELDYLAAVARGDLVARQGALESLMRLTPANAKLYRDLADLQFAERKFPEAVRNYEQAGRLDSADPQLWNQLGYARAEAGDLNGARGALQQYQQLLPPDNANPLDSLGEASFYLGDFSGAEKYFLAADQKNRAEFGGADLLKAAQARLLSGELAEADSLFQKYTGLMQGRERERAAYQQTQWEFLTGRRQAAMAGLQNLMPTLQGDGKSLGLSQLSLWKLETGDTGAAVQLATDAEHLAASPATRNISAVCLGLAQPGTAPAGSRLTAAYSLLFAKRYADAVPLLEMLYRETNPQVDGQIRTLLAWAYVQANRVADAARVLGPYPIPLSSGDPVFASLIFPRYLFVRAAVLSQKGKRAEAKAAYQLFLKYAGDAPGIFGDEQTAQKNLASL